MTVEVETCSWLRITILRVTKLLFIPFSNIKSIATTNGILIHKLIATFRYSVRTVLILCLTPDESDVNITDRFTVEMLLRTGTDYAYLNLPPRNAVLLFNPCYLLSLNVVKLLLPCRCRLKHVSQLVLLSVTLLFALSQFITRFLKLLWRPIVDGARIAFPDDNGDLPFGTILKALLDLPFISVKIRLI